MHPQVAWYHSTPRATQWYRAFVAQETAPRSSLRRNRSTARQFAFKPGSRLDLFGQDEVGVVAGDRAVVRRKGVGKHGKSSVSGPVKIMGCDPAAGASLRAAGSRINADTR